MTSLVLGRLQLQSAVATSTCRTRSCHQSGGSATSWLTSVRCLRNASAPLHHSLEPLRHGSSRFDASHHFSSRLCSTHLPELLRSVPPPDMVRLRLGVHLSIGPRCPRQGCTSSSRSLSGTCGQVDILRVCGRASLRKHKTFSALPVSLPDRTGADNHSIPATRRL